MPPKKELCRNFMRGSCHFGDRCKFLHAAQTPSRSNPVSFGVQNGSLHQQSNLQQQKPNPFGFGVQSGNQSHSTSLQQQKSNPFGFGVQTNSQSKGGFSNFGSRQNQSKPFENKWIRPSQTNPGGSSASRQPDNPSGSHKCTDPESCKRQIAEDFENERPLWKLTCYGHTKNGPCDIVGDISYEELRTAAYDDAKRGLNMQAILLEINASNDAMYLGSQQKQPLCVFTRVRLRTPDPPDPNMFGNILGVGTSYFSLGILIGETDQDESGSCKDCKPYFSFCYRIMEYLSAMVERERTLINAKLAEFDSLIRNPNNASLNSVVGTQSPFHDNTKNSNNPSFSSFSHLGTSMSVATSPLTIPFGQPHLPQNIPTTGSFGGQLLSQTLQNPFGRVSTGFNNISPSSQQNQFFSSTVSSQISNSTGEPFNGSFSGGLAMDSAKFDLNTTPVENLDGYDSIWTAENWTIGKIPESVPPAKYCR